MTLARHGTRHSRTGHSRTGHSRTGHSRTRHSRTRHSRTGKTPDRSGLRVLAFLALTQLALASAAWTQDDEDTRRHGIFIDTLDVSLVNVEVMATRGGEPVTDLTREDFEILDDGEPVEVTNFFRVDAGRRVPQGEEAAVVDDEASPAPAVVQERAFVVVLVDQAFIAPASRARVFRSLRERLDSLMSDGTQVMVASKQRQVKVVQRPTTDRAEIEAALDSLAMATARNFSTRTRMTIREIERGMTFADLEPLARPDAVEGDAHHTFGLARALSQEVYQEVRHSVRVLHDFMGSLSGLPGRKAVLYVCDRLPLRPGELPWIVWFEKYGFDFATDFGVTSVDTVLREFDTAGEVKDLIADATASRIAFYPVGAGPSAGVNAVSAENATAAVTVGTLSQVTDIGGGLRMLANGTGGQAATGGSSTAWLFDRLRQDLTNYYSLAYASPHRGDGEKHRIEVRVRRPDVKLHYLGSYRDKSKDQEMNDRTLASLMLETTENPLDVRVVTGEVERQKKGKYLMEMEVRFPISKLVLLPREKDHVGSVSIVLIVRDAKGRLSDPVKVLVPIRVPHDGILQALSRTAVYQTKLAIRGGEQTVAVGVHDDIGSTSSTVNVNVDVGGSHG